MTDTVVDVIVAALKRHGVTEIFGQSLPSAFFLAAERSGIRQVVYRTENGGGAMADGYARASNRIGIVGAQNGPAATLLVPPMTEAMLVSIPMLAIVQDVPSPTRDKNAFQELDHHELFSGCSKWTRRLTDVSRAEEYVDMAITAATTGKPGPVVLLLPKDVMISDAVPSKRQRTASLGTFPLDRTRPDSAQVSLVARLLSEARQPIIFAGGGVNRSLAATQLAALQESFSIPVATTNMGKGSVDERHPLSMGVVGSVMGARSSTRFMKSYIEESDVIVLVGNRTNENGTDGWNLIPADATVIHIDFDGAEIGRNYESVRVVGDARLALEDLAHELSTIDTGRRASGRAAAEAAIADARASHAAELVELVDLDKSPIRPERVMHELNDIIDDKTILVADASYSTIWLSNYIQCTRAGQQFIYPRGMAGLGWGLPMAIGAKVANPDADVICITGDGGFGHVWSEIETAVRMNIPIVVILLNNSILGFQKHSELVQFSDHTSAIGFSDVDHAAIARASGAQGIRVDDPNELKAAITEALASKKVTLIEVIADPDAFPPITAWEARAGVLPASFVEV